jgi:hypothetical protein
MATDQIRLNAIGIALQNKGATKPCARCGHSHFSVVDETLLTLQPLSGDFILGGDGVPVVIVACNNCGNLWHHALAPIGMLPKHLKEWHSPNSVDKYYCQNLNGRNANAKSQIHS